MQTNEKISHKDVKTNCNTNKFTVLTFSGPHMKPNGVRVLGKNYHMQFEPKLGHGTCAMRQIHCACIQYTAMLDKYWTPNMPPE